MVSADEGQHVLAGLASIPSDIKNFVVKYIADMTANRLGGGRRQASVNKFARKIGVKL